MEKPTGGYESPSAYLPRSLHYFSSAYYFGGVPHHVQLPPSAVSAIPGLPAQMIGSPGSLQFESKWFSFNTYKIY